MAIRRKSSKRTSARKKRPGAKSVARRRAKPRKKRAPAAKSPRPAVRAARLDTASRTRGLGSDAGGQAGDTEGISRAEMADSESVEELLEEGQSFEAGIISGVEDAPDADKGGIRTREVPEDDVPQEYLDED